MSQIFISHSSRDKLAATALKERLAERRHYSVFLDCDPEKGIVAGVSWERTLYTQLRACRAVIALVTDHYLESHWCFAEVALARMEGKEIFALQLEPWSTTAAMPSILTQGQNIDLRADEEEGYRRLWRGFSNKGISSAADRSWVPGQPPYPGLMAFEEKDAAIFYGREQEVRQGIELLNRLKRQGHPRLLQVLGASGSGKSSLVRAGILPQLRLDSAQWSVVGPVRPGSNPTRRLAAAWSHALGSGRWAESPAEIYRRLSADGSEEPTPAVVDEDTAFPALDSAESARQRLLEAVLAVEDQLASDPRMAAHLQPLRRLLVDSTDRPEPLAQPGRKAGSASDSNPILQLAWDLSLIDGSGDKKVVLVIDQLEELLDRDNEVATTLLGQLRDALAADDSPLLILSTMRSDFLAAFQQAPALNDLDFASLLLGPMSLVGMRQVIEEPARLAGIELETGLTEVLLADTGTADALPLLAFMLRVLWDQYRHSRSFDRLKYDALGGLHGALAQVADETFKTALELGDEQGLRQAFLAMARVSEGAANYSRRPLRWDDLDDPESVRQQLDLFVDQRLLVSRGDETLEVAHETLFRSWQRLRNWLDQSAATLHLRREIQSTAQRWHGAQKNAEYLWHGGRLARASELRTSGELRLGGLEAEFFEASEQAEEARQATEQRRRQRELEQARALANERARSARRYRKSLLLSITLGLIAVVTGINAWLQAQRAQERSRQAIKAEQAARVQAAKALAIQARTAGYPLDVALLMAVGAGQILHQEGNTADLFEARTSLFKLLHASPGLEVFLHGHEQDIWTLAFSPDGRWLASGSSDGRLLLWNVAERRQQFHLDHCSDGGCEGERIKRLVFSPNGQWLASGTELGKIMIWHVESGSLHQTLQDSGVLVNALAYGPDGRILVSADWDGQPRVWNLESGSNQLLPDRHDGWVTGMAFRPDGALVSSSVDKTIRIWDLAARTSRLLHRNDQAVKGLSISEDGSVAAGFADGSIRVWHPDERPAFTQTGVNRGEVTHLAFLADGKLIGSASSSGVVVVADARSGRPTGIELSGFVVAASPLDNGLVATAEKNGSLKLWDLSRITATTRRTGHPTDLVGMSFGSRQLIATGGLDGRVEVTRRDSWPEPSSPWTGQPETEDQETEKWSQIRQQNDEVWALAFSPDEQWLAVSSGASGLSLWDHTGPRPAATESIDVVEHRKWIWSASVNASGEWVASADEQGRVLLRPVSRIGPLEELPTTAGHSVLTVAFHSKDPNILALGYKSGWVEIWHLENGIEHRCIGHQNQINHVAFDARGTRLASASLGGTTRLWNLEDGCQEPTSILRSRVGFYRVAFSADGELVSTGDMDGVIRIWDAESGTPMLGLLGHEEKILGLAFADEWLLSGSADRTLRRWQIGLWDDLDQALAKACALVNRNLDHEEWTDLFGQMEYQRSCSILTSGTIQPTGSPSRAAVDS